MLGLLYSSMAGMKHRPLQASSLELALHIIWHSFSTIFLRAEQIETIHLDHRARTFGTCGFIDPGFDFEGAFDADLTAFFRIVFSNLASFTPDFEVKPIRLILIFAATIDG